MRYTIQNDSANELLDRKMAEYAQAVCHDRPHFHIALVQDISPNCDCHGENDAPILPDIGMFASFDPVALDQACRCPPECNTDCKTVSLRTSGRAGMAIATTIISKIPIRISSGKQPLTRQKRSDLEQENMN